MEKTVKLTYDEFLKIKASGYSLYMVKYIVCKKLSINETEIDDIEFNYGLTVKVWLR